MFKTADFWQEKKTFIFNTFFLLGLSLFFISFQLKTVYGGDSGDYLSAAAVWGIPHPPGYPLFSFLASFLHNFFNFSTPAFRVAFLSTIPAVITVFTFFRLLRKFFSFNLSLITSLFLASLYPFWLYSELVEVFSLNNMFLVLLPYLFFSYLKTNKNSFLNLFFLALGLSFAHHHTIVFLLPAFFIIAKDKFLDKKNWQRSLLILPGFIFYLYFIWAANRQPPINWGNPVNLANLLGVFLREGYGTFRAAAGIDNTLVGRFFSVFAFFRFLLVDFNLFGFLLIGLGLFYKQKQKSSLKNLFKRFSIIAVLSYIVFLFYASFKLNNDFGVATYERFLLAPYIFSTVLLVFGMEALLKLLEKIFSKSKQRIIVALSLVIFAIFFPLTNLIKNYPKIRILQNDFTAEEFAKDALNSVADGGIVFFLSDTSYFNTAYLYYSLDYHSDRVKLINFYGLTRDYYRSWLRQNSPQLNIKEPEGEEANFTNFLELNIDHFPIYSIPSIPVEGFTTIPYGLVYRYFREGQEPSPEEVLEINKKLWSSYSSPLSGSLSKYKNLFLTDVLSYYYQNSKRLGDYLLQKGYLKEAESYLLKSLEYEAGDPETHLLLGKVWLEAKQCKKAEEKFLELKTIIPDNPFPDAYLRQVYLNCFSDEQKASQFLDSCLQKEKEGQPQLPQ